MMMNCRSNVEEERERERRTYDKKRLNQRSTNTSNETFSAPSSVFVMNIKSLVLLSATVFHDQVMLKVILVQVLRSFYNLDARQLIEAYCRKLTVRTTKKMKSNHAFDAKSCPKIFTAHAGTSVSTGAQKLTSGCCT